MKNLRLYQPNLIEENSTIKLSKEHSHYLFSVMRKKAGDKINLFNKQGEWSAKIINTNKHETEITLIEKIKIAQATKNLELAVCLVKKNPMDLILQKATELGVSKIIPIVSERTEVKEFNHERAMKIVIEATEQSNQLSPPEITQVTKLNDFIDKFNDQNLLLFADVNSKNALDKNKAQGKNLSILIGPEGDFSPDERALITSKSSTYCFSLSSNILRTDTAVIAAISLVNFINNSY